MSYAGQSGATEPDSITGRKSLAGLIVFLFIAAAWSSAPFFRPGVLNGERFVFHDNSYALFTADQLLAGKLIFRDVFYQYGVLTAYLHAAWAALFGNTIFAYWHLAQFLTCLGIVELWLLLRRTQRTWPALVFGTIILFPYFLVPGGLAGGVGASVYVALERICLLSIALAWRPPATRSFGSALSIGLLLGAMQWVKFGGAFVAGVSLLLSDVLILSYAPEEKKGWLHWLTISSLTLLGFLLIEGSLIVLAYVSLPAQLASEILWPSWMVQNYEAYRYKSVPIWHWFNFNYFVGVQMPMVAAGVASLVFICHLLVRRKAGPEERSRRVSWAGPPLLFLIFFVLALIIYLPHMWVTMPYVWLILLPAAFFLQNAPRFCQGIFLVCCFPAFLLSVKGVLYPQRAGQLREVHLANDTLCLPPETADRLANLQRVLDLLEREHEDHGPGRLAILGFPIGSGFHHFLGYPAATRHAWFMPGFIQPREEDAFLKSLDRTLAVIVFFPDRSQPDPPSPDPSSWEFFSVPLFSRSTCLAFASRLKAPIKVDSHCWVFPVRVTEGRNVFYNEHCVALPFSG